MQKTVIVADLTFWTESFGNSENPPCLLICGAGAPAKFWTAPFCETIASAGYFVIRYDHRDQGLSSSVDYDKDPYTIKDLADDAIGILDAYGVVKAHVVGHSMGGAIAQLLAIHYPERVLSLTAMCISTIGAAASPPKEVMDLLLENKPIQNFERDLPGFLRSWGLLNGDVEFDEEMAIAYTRDFYERSHLDVGVAWNHIRAMQRLGDISDNLKNISIPTLFIAGEKDVLMPMEGVKANAQVIPEAKCTVISKMGHMIFNRDLEKKIAEILLEHFHGKNSAC